MNKLAIITVLFDYPEHFKPTFEDKLLKDIDPKDYYIIRYRSDDYGISKESYYFKFTFYRIREIVRFIKENILNKYEYFIALDATDVGYVGSINNFSEIIKDYNCNILFGAERNLWPDTQYSHLYPSKGIQSPYKFLNAGAFCANTHSFLEHIESILKRELIHLCDQGNWQIEYLLNSDIQIDYKNQLVLNTFLAKPDIIINNNKIEFVNSTPIFVHDNGGYNEDTVKLMKYFI
jgi:hypothetical protein